MTERSQITVSLSKEAIEILEKQATPRKRGEFISNLLMSYGADGGAISQSDIETMRLQLLGLASTQKNFDARLTRVERQMEGRR